MLHERVVLLTVQVEEVPQVPAERRAAVTPLGQGFYQVVLHYGFVEEVDVPRDLLCVEAGGAPIHMMTTSFFLGRQKVVATEEEPGMALWRERLFALMLRGSESAMEFFKLPTNRVVELGSQLRI